MPADQPTILATSGGYRQAQRTYLEFDALVHHAVELSGVTGRAPRLTVLLEQDVVWVNGGSVANLLAVWDVHDLRPAMRAAWEAGVVLSGVSAGSICWYVGGTTDSFGPELRAVTNGLALLPFGNGVHYDSEARRRPLVHRLVADGTLPTTHCTDDGVGLVYHGTELVEAVSERDGKGAYVVTREGDRAVEERVEPRRLPNP